MSPALWVVVGVAFSYLITAAKDLSEYRPFQFGVWGILLRAWPFLLLSLVLRSLAIALMVHTLPVIIAGFHATPSLVRGNGWGMLVISLVAGACAATAPSIGTATAHRRAVQELKIAWWVQILIRIDTLTWPRIRHEYEFLFAEQTNRFWRDAACHVPVFQLFEENKDTIVKFFFKRRGSFGVRLWLYLGLMAGDGNTKRLEALMYVYGMRWIRREVASIRGGRECTIPAVDRRHLKTKWLSRPPIDRLLTSKRRCEVLIGELLSLA